jgi:hypothetical protein
MAGQSYDTIAQTQTIADTPDTWSQSLDFAQFDPSLGTLLNINIGLAGDVDGSVSIENLEAAPAVFSVALSSLISVAGPDDTFMASTAPQASASVSLGAFDGTLDYAGNSGTTLGALSNTQTQDVVLQPGTSGTDPFVGTGTVALPVTASTSLEATGPANMQILSHASAGAAVTLDYNYGAPGSSGQDSSGDVLDFFSISVSAPLFGTAADSLTTAVQTFSFADSTTGWTNFVAAQQFDPSLGALEQVNFTLSSDIQASVAAENLDPTAASIATTQTATVTLDPVGSSQTLSTDASVATHTTLAAYDGSMDFAGPSGFIDQGLTAGPSNEYTSTATSSTSDDLAAYTGQGTVDLPIVSSSTATLDGPGNLLAQLLAQSGATVTVSYTYQPVPVVSNASDTVSFIPGSTVAADPGISLSDVGTSSLTGATVAITGGLLAGDWLAADTGGTGISASYDPTDGTLTLSGTATVAAYQQVLSSVAFSSSAGDPTAGGSDTTRTLTWAVTDDFAATSAAVTSTIAVQTPATFTSSPAENVAITQAGTYTVASLQSANSFVLDSPGATLVLDASLDVAAGFTLEAGTLVFDGGTLSVGSYDQTGGVAVGNTIDIVAASSFAVVGGSIVAGGTLAIASTASLLGGSSDTALTGGLIPLGTFAATPVVIPGSLVTLGAVQPLVVTPAGNDGLDGVVLQSLIVADEPSLIITPFPVIAPVSPIAFINPAVPVFAPAADPPASLLPALAVTAAAPATDPVSAGPPYGGGLVTAESLGLDPAELASGSGAAPDAPDVWQIVSQTDTNIGDFEDVLLNPVVHTWVALTMPEAGAFSSSTMTGGGPVASLAQFLSNEQTHPT